MAKTEAEIFERIRDALSPHGIETEISERRGTNLSLKFTKPGHKGSRTLHITARRNEGDVRLRMNQVSDAKRICREAGWIELEPADAERAPVTTTSPAIAAILNARPEPALGAALRDSLMNSTIIQQAQVEMVDPDKPSSGVGVLAEYTPPPPAPKPPKVVTGRLGVYGEGPGRAPSFMVVVPISALTPHMMDQFWAPEAIQGDVITMRPSTRGTRRWHQYATFATQRAVRFDIDKNSPLLADGVYGLTECLIEISEDETITILAPTQDRRDVRTTSRTQEQEAPPMTAAPAPQPVAAAPAPVVAERNPIDVLREAKETINAMRKKVPGLVVGVTPEGDVEFTLKI